MNPKVKKVLLGMVFAGFVISNLVLIRTNARVSAALDTANRLIAKLQKNSFHDNIISDSSAASEIVLLNYQQPERLRSDNRDQFNSIKPLGPDSTPGLSLLDLKSRYLGKTARSGFTLFIFFSPTDCPACLQEGPIWEKLHLNTQHLDLQVIGIMNHPDKAEGEQFLKELGVTFPVFFDNTAFLKNKYRIGETPEKVLIDSKGNTLLINPGSPTEERRRAFEESLLKLVIGKGPQ